MFGITNFKYDRYYQTLYVVWLNHIFLILFLFFYFQWWMIPFILVNIHIFGLFSEVSLHRYFTHKSYKTTKSKEYLLKIFAVFSAQGSVLTWVTTHRSHHAFDDTEKDPHSPLHMPWWKIYLGLFTKKYQKKFIIDILRRSDRKYFIFEDKYYYLIWTTIWITAWLIHPFVFFFVVSGAAGWYFATSIVNIFSHAMVLGKPRDKNYTATNSKILNLLTGMGNHNNHHANPGSYTYSIDKEIDLYGLFIKKFLKI